jgi:hypothetical protein
MQNAMNIFHPLLGQLVWSIRKDESSLTMEFGTPFLSVREPVVASSEASTKVERILARRRVFVQGEWHFWLRDCEWEISAARYSISRRDIGNLTTDQLQELDGQVLQSVENGRLPDSLSFRFDLGAELQIWPLVGAEDDRWSLHRRGGDIVVCQVNGELAFEKGTPSELP